MDCLGCLKAVPCISAKLALAKLLFCEESPLPAPTKSILFVRLLLCPGSCLHFTAALWLTSVHELSPHNRFHRATTDFHPRTRPALCTSPPAHDLQSTRALFLDIHTQSPPPKLQHGQERRHFQPQEAHHASPSSCQSLWTVFARMGHRSRSHHRSRQEATYGESFFLLLWLRSWISP